MLMRGDLNKILEEVNGLLEEIHVQLKDMTARLDSVEQKQEKTKKYPLARRILWKIKK